MKKLYLFVCLIFALASACASTSLWVKKNPNPHTLLNKVYAEACPAGYESSTEDAAEAWITAQKAAGWVAAPAPTPAPAVPESVTKRQLKEWLIAHDLIDAVEAKLAAISDAKAKRIALNWWTESQDFRRDHPLLIQFAGELGLSSAQIDTIFQEAILL